MKSLSPRSTFASLPFNIPREKRDFKLKTEKITKKVDDWTRFDLFLLERSPKASGLAKGDDPAGSFRPERNRFDAAGWDVIGPDSCKGCEGPASLFPSQRMADSSLFPHVGLLKERRCLFDSNTRPRRLKNGWYKTNPHL